MLEFRHWALTASTILLLAAPDVSRGAPSAPPDSGSDSDAVAEETYELFRMLADALDQVEQNYVEPISRRELFEAAIEGVIEKLDPYSSYIKPEDMDALRQSVENEFSGIGVRLARTGGRLMVMNVIAGTPASQSGLTAGDEIRAIEGRPIEGVSLEEVVQRIKGPVGTKVRLTIERAGEQKTRRLSIKRDVIHIETVVGLKRKTDGSWQFMLDPEQRVGYVHITLFGRKTALELKRIVENLQREGLRGLIIDLRFNPGGLLQAAIDVADLFVDEGRIVSIIGRNTRPRKVTATREGSLVDFPMAVLVNRFSASGSEILAACLQDHRRAAVVGERTWGKGSVQNVIELEDGKSALKLTTSRYIRPNGQNIHRPAGAKESDAWGVEPDTGLEVALNQEEIGRLLLERRRRELADVSTESDGGGQDSSPVNGTASGPETRLSNDRQLRHALAYVHEKLAEQPAP